MLNRLYRRYFLMAIIGAILAVSLFASAMAAENVRLGYLVGDDVHVREKASTDSDIIGKKDGSDIILIAGSKGQFFQVHHDDELGYIVDDFVRALPHDEAVVNARNVILRKEPSTDSSKLDTLSSKSVVNVYGETDGFYKVTFEDNIGYIAKQYIDFDSSEESTSGVESSSPSSPIQMDLPTEGVKTPEGKLVEREGDIIKISEDEVLLIAKLVQAEGGANGKDAARALASIVYNRIKNKKFPSTIDGVCYQKGQFSVVNNRESFLARVPSQDQIEAVKEVFLEGKPVLPENIMFFKSARLDRNWGGYRTYYATIGGNMFYS